jgi:hypothetical protein
MIISPFFGILGSRRMQGRLLIALHIGPAPVSGAALVRRRSEKGIVYCGSWEERVEVE